MALPSSSERNGGGGGQTCVLITVETLEVTIIRNDGQGGALTGAQVNR